MGLLIKSYLPSNKEQKAIKNATNSSLATVNISIKNSKTRTITIYFCINTTDSYYIEVYHIDVPTSSLSEIHGDPFDDSTGLDINPNGFSEVIDIKEIRKDQ